MLTSLISEGLINFLGQIAVFLIINHILTYIFWDDVDNDDSDYEEEGGTRDK